MAGEAQVNIILTAEERTARAVESVDRQMKDLAATVKKTAGMFDTFKAKFKTAFQFDLAYNAIRSLQTAFWGLVHLLPNLIRRGEEWGDTVDEISDITGMAAEESSELAAVQMMLGNSTMRLSQAMLQFGRNVELHPKVMKELGAQIVLTNTGAVDAYATFNNLRTAISNYGASTTAVKYATILLGRGTRDMLDLLLMSPAAYRAAAAEARRFGLILTEAGSAALEQWKRTKAMLDLAITGIGAQVAQAVAPALTSLVSAISNAIADNLQNIARFAASIVGFITGLISGLFGLNLNVQITGAALIDLWKGQENAYDGVKRSQDKAMDSTRGATEAIQRQIDAIDAKLAALDRAEDRRNARREFKELMQDIAEARRTLREVRDQSVFAASMSNAEAELARQAHARDIIDAQKKLRDAEQRLDDWRREQARARRRQALEDRRNELQDQLAAIKSNASQVAAINKAMAADMTGVYTRGGKTISAETKKAAREMAATMQRAVMESQQAGRDIAKAIQDAVFGPEVTPAGGIFGTGRTGTGGLVGALSGLGGIVSAISSLVPHVQRLVDLIGGPEGLIVAIVGLKFLGPLLGAGGTGGLLGLIARLTPMTASLTAVGVGLVTLGTVLKPFVDRYTQNEGPGQSLDPRMHPTSDTPMMPLYNRQKILLSMLGSGWAPPTPTGGYGRPEGPAGALPKSRNPFGSISEMRDYIFWKMGLPFSMDPTWGGSYVRPAGPAGSLYGGYGNGNQSIGPQPGPAPGALVPGLGITDNPASGVLTAFTPLYRRFLDFSSPVGTLLSDSLGTLTQGWMAGEETAANTASMVNGVNVVNVPGTNIGVKGNVGLLSTNNTVNVGNTAIGVRGNVGILTAANTVTVGNTSLGVTGNVGLLTTANTVKVGNTSLGVRGNVGILSTANTVTVGNTAVAVTGDVGLLTDGNTVTVGNKSIGIWGRVGLLNTANTVTVGNTTIPVVGNVGLLATNNTVTVGNTEVKVGGNVGLLATKNTVNVGTPTVKVGAGAKVGLVSTQNTINLGSVAGGVTLAVKANSVDGVAVHVKQAAGSFFRVGTVTGTAVKVFTSAFNPLRVDNTATDPLWVKSVGGAAAPAVESLIGAVTGTASAGASAVGSVVNLVINLDGRQIARAIGLNVGPGTSTVMVNA